MNGFNGNNGGLIKKKLDFLLPRWDMIFLDIIGKFNGWVYRGSRVGLEYLLSFLRLL